MIRRIFQSAVVLSLLVLNGTAGEDDYRKTIRNASPILYWDFEDQSDLFGAVTGDVKFGTEGPTSKNSPLLPARNKAATFGGDGARIVVKDPGAGSQFDFENGDPIAIECWVNATEISKGAHAYIIGKGRTGNKGFSANNQNWALRLTGDDGAGVPNFLFRSRDEKAMKGDFHRWKANSGVQLKSGWHHLVLTYVFGKPDSISAWIDGEKLTGTWDMGGATNKEPFIDDDEIWVGSTTRGSSSNSFQGAIDELVVYRREFDEELLAARVKIPEYEPPVDSDSIPEGKVRVEIIENIGVKRKWPRRFPDADPKQEFVDDYFAFYQLPQKYNDTGLREKRSNPMMIRASAKVVLPDENLRIVLRTRGAGRLWLDGKMIAETSFAYTGGGAHNGVMETTLQHSSEMRILGPGDRESLVLLKGDGKPHVVVLETILGNGTVRTSLGETSVSVSEAGGEFHLLSPQEKNVWLSKEGWDDFRQDRIGFFRDLDSQKRRLAASSEDDYWQKRHDYAAKIVTAKLEPGEIDGLLKASWAKAAGAGPVSSLAQEVQAIFSEKCFRCHGEKVKGGLRLDEHEALLKGGDSEIPALVAGNPEESYLVELIHPDAEDRMPPKGDALSKKERATIQQWIANGAKRFDRVGSSIEPSLIVSDLDFLRRATLDTVGLVPSPEEIETFLSDDENSRRSNAIDRLLADERWADHWVSYWQDVLAENPNILKPTLNNTGPFRFWIYESLLDNKPMDQFVTELVKMEGSSLIGGPAGFGLAFQNDVPMAAKANTIGTAFLGVEMKCARCHDAPYHESKQRDLFELAAMLNQKEIKLPESSTVPVGSIPEGRKPLIEMTLKAGETIKPRWPFGELSEADSAPDWADVNTQREEVAWNLTSPHNNRFAQVMANRVWKKLLGAGFVDPVDDWEAGKPTHPELLNRLANHFVASGYDLKEIVRVIMKSETYQRESRPNPIGQDPTFSHQIQRRMSAEQVVDSLFAVSGKPLDSEELTMDNDGTQAEKNMINLGLPQRAWEFTSLSNERDRPSLAIPKAQAVVDVLENFGWRSARAEPKTERETAPNVRQSAIIANGLIGRWVTTLTEDHAVTKLATRPDTTLNEFINDVFIRVLSRTPSESERILYTKLLTDGFDSRIIPEAKRPQQKKWPQLGHVAWSNHLSAEANSIKIEMEKRASTGDFPTVTLKQPWRENVEDMLWAMLNSPEFIFMP